MRRDPRFCPPRAPFTALPPLHLLGNEEGHPAAPRHPVGPEYRGEGVYMFTGGRRRRRRRRRTEGSTAERESAEGEERDEDVIDRRHVRELEHLGASFASLV